MNNNNGLEQLLLELETILPQFYNQGGDDSKLRLYQSKSDAQENVLYFLRHSQSQFVIHFSLSILESKINKRWVNLSAQEQNDLKTIVFDLYLRHNALVNYNVTKVAQLIADIGRYEFQTNSQNYINEVMSLVNNPQTSLRGILLLKEISTEFTTSKGVISQNTKNTLRKLLLERVPTIIQVLTTSLNQLLDQTSPHPDTNNYETKVNSIFETLLSYFSWIPLNEFLTPTLLETLFRYLELSNISSLKCLNEILSKNCVPREFQEFLFRVFNEINKLTNHIVKNTAMVSQLGYEFINKFTLLISLFVSNHLRRVENNPNFSIQTFLANLFQYTLLQSTTLTDSYKICMDIWKTFLDYLLTNVNEQGVASPAKYTDGLIQLQSELVKRILFAFNKDFLDQLQDGDEDDDQPADDEEIDFNSCSTYIDYSINIISKITELYPKEGLKSLAWLFTQSMELAQLIPQAKANNSLSSLTSNVKDITTILKLFARLTHLFVPNFGETYDYAIYVYNGLLQMCQVCEIHKVYNVGSDFIKLHDQILCTIRSFSYWLGDYGNEVRVKPAGQADYDRIIAETINIIVPLFNGSVPQTISISAGRLLNSLAVVAKPSCLFNQTEVVITNIHNICLSLPTPVQSIIYSAISSTILTPPSNVNLNHQWDIRRPKYSPFVKGITSQYLEIPQIQGFIDSKLYLDGQVIQRIQKTLNIVTSIMKTVPDVTMAKGILHDAIQDILPVTLRLFVVYINVPSVLSSILDFFFTLFECLKTQVGVNFTQQTISTFLEILGGDNLKQLLTSSNDIGNSIVQKLIEILTFSIQTYGHSFETLLTPIISFAMEKIYPVIIDSTSPIKPLLFSLLYTILDNHWRYFFPTSTIASSNNNNNSANGQSQQQQTSYQQLASILTAFQKTFQQNDVNLFKQNLEYFEKLNMKHKLYEKIIQEPGFSKSLIFDFFKSLTSGCQSINSEDIINTTYHFASIDFPKFYHQYFVEYLSTSELTVDQKNIIKTNFSNEKDHPTFNRNMNQFINDFSYYTFLIKN
ncbi:exportin 6 [Cavenderia fasciculata]|uniref:Exportin 6 n=1 Tax=Cavenderia fasciculata TaxID=261658 RepID=F4PWG0_CACFS|nr:exportin 6 [Cavenderia fasciculata]EGG20324.1 exportin 6 [Cavenderia fasciculata]|eukprot:XP_004367307.1 exportin 6 [Cavenderia fasciculata]